MRTILNQQGTMFFTVSANQQYSLCEVEVNNEKRFSVGIENLSFAVYRKQNRAAAALRAVLEFLNDDTRKTFQFKQDTAAKK